MDKYRNLILSGCGNKNTESTHHYNVCIWYWVLSCLYHISNIEPNIFAILLSFFWSMHCCPHDIYYLHKLLKKSIHSQFL